MGKSQTHNEFVLRPPPGTRFSIFGADVHLDFERGREREIYTWLQGWMESFILPEVERADAKLAVMQQRQQQQQQQEIPTPPQPYQGRQGPPQPYPTTPSFQGRAPAGTAGRFPLKSNPRITSEPQPNPVTITESNKEEK